jgi:hypothetical protein
VRLRFVLLSVRPKVVVKEAELSHHVKIILSVRYLLLHATSLAKHVLNGFGALTVGALLFAFLLEVI